MCAKLNYFVYFVWIHKMLINLSKQIMDKKKQYTDHYMSISHQPWFHPSTNIVLLANAREADIVDLGWYPGIYGKWYLIIYKYAVLGLFIKQSYKNLVTVMSKISGCHFPYLIQEILPFFIYFTTELEKRILAWNKYILCTEYLKWLLALY